VSTACPRCALPLDATRLPVCPRCLLQAEIEPALLGDSIELHEEIGRGGMGTVHRAHHIRLDRPVAVKFLAEPLASQPEFAERFRREARALARLNHPGIVAVHDYGEQDGRGYIVMELVDGQPLSRLLPLPADRARALVLEILDALGYAHAAGMVHRDLKPANVLVDSSGRAKLTDFGLARPLEGWTLTTAGRVAGTPQYMAPELLQGAPPDPRQDVFAMGALLYEILAGHPPAGDFVRLPQPFDRIARKALAPDPSRRYANASDMRADLLGATVPDRAELPPDERQWLRAVALVQTLATAVALWAFLLSVTPKIIGPQDVQPLVMLAAQPLPDGRIVSRARFEIWPTLAAVAAIVFAVGSQGWLRRHFRDGGYEVSAPERPVPAARAVFACGAVALTVYAVRRLADAGSRSLASPYVPIVGGLIELACVYLAWIAILDARRTGRPLVREVPLWAGVGLALVPPVRDLAMYLASWRP
jgi:eukaryotic-like serine/threonine-protein kinase